MNVERIPVTMTSGDTATAGANTAVVLTYAAAAATRHVVEGIVCSYSAPPTGGNLKIEDGAGVTIFQADITASGPTIIPLPAAIRGSNNTALIVTLSAGGASVVGKLNVLHRTM